MEKAGILNDVTVGGSLLPSLGTAPREFGSAAVSLGTKLAALGGALGGAAAAGASSLQNTGLYGLAGLVAAALAAKAAVVIGPRALHAVADMVVRRRSDAAVARMLPHAEAFVAAMGGQEGPVARLDEAGYLVWREPGAEPVRMDRKEFAAWRREVDATETPLVVVDAKARADWRELIICRYVHGRLEGATLEAPGMVRLKADGTTVNSYFELGAPVDTPEQIALPAPVR